MTTPTMISLDLIDDNPYQPRLHYDEAAVRETAESIHDRAGRRAGRSRSAS